MPLSCWRERDGICWLALCKLQNVLPCSFTQFVYRFQCFLLNQVRPSLNVLIFIFWSLTFLRERSGLVFSFGGFPLEKFADIQRCLMLFPHYRFIIPTSRFNRFRQFRGIVWLAKHMLIRYIWVPESCLSFFGRQMLGSNYNLVPRAFPLENGKSAKALGTRIKLTAKTVHEDPASYERWISRKEI